MAIQEELKKSQAPVTWVRPEGLHLTLKFLGETSPSRLSSIEGALQLAAEGTGPLEIKMRELGVFPNARNPRVLWLGVHPADHRMADLKQRIDQELTALGFPKEERDFRPHLTLARIKSTRGLSGLWEAMGKITADSLGDYTLREVDLIQSELAPDGTRYTTVRSVPM